MYIIFISEVCTLPLIKSNTRTIEFKGTICSLTQHKRKKRAGLMKLTKSMTLSRVGFNITLSTLLATYNSFLFTTVKTNLHGYYAHGTQQSNIHTHSLSLCSVTTIISMATVLTTHLMLGRSSTGDTPNFLHCIPSFQSNCQHFCCSS